MKFVAFSAISLLVSVASAFHIIPPASITTCAPLTVGYDTRTGIAPFTLSFRTGSADGPVVAAFTDVTGTSFTWDLVTIPAGTNVVIQLADSSGLGSASGVITVSAGNSDVCLNNPTSIPPIPTVTSSRPPSSELPPSSTNSSSLSSSLPSSLSSSTSSGLSSSLSSLSSVLSSASSLASSLTRTTSTPGPTSTGGLSDNGAVIPNSAGLISIGIITAFVGALLA